ncbi:hypothetical protein AWB74_06859 [Caballeronia arvi]|uniref:Uncharacterized protein n=1 Tax=Caballeronia arvi TaxID=1777135 RepID=A0A158KUD2_9BURK|nr:hypothetical protein [Caballeronia arvi]SAL84210.1 hypothetical protein AWB74_06859 [Caballeronia arvi]
MPHQAKLPEESVADRASPANDPTVLNLPEPAIDYDDPGPVRSPLRFGRLALWMASATALGIGVLGTVAYSMWFNHDQRVYAEAMASARKTLGIDQPVIAARTESSGMVEAPLAATPPGYTSPYVATGGPAAIDTAAPVDTTTLADNPPTADAADEPTLADASDASTATATAQAQLQQADDPSSAPPVQSAAVQRRGNASAQQTASYRANPSAQPRRHQARAKPEGGLFARMGAFFHRVSYRNNVPNRQREEYSRP